MRVRVLLLLLVAAAVVGCEPTAPTSGPTDGAGPAKLEGIWVATKVDIAGQGKLFSTEQLGAVCMTVKGDLITVRQKGDPTVTYYVFKVDTTKTPNAITFRKSDEKGTAGEEVKDRGIVRFDTDVVRLAVTA